MPTRRGGVACRLTVACALALSALGSARADEETSGSELLVRPVLAVGFGGSASGAFAEAQAGIRLSALLLRLSLDVGGHQQRGFALGAAHADVVVASGDLVAAFVGLGVGAMGYGFLLEGPTHDTTAWLPEAGLILWHRNLLGRVVVTAAAVLPASTAQPDTRYHIDPPGFLASAAASF
jgi:hypothetical protein